MLSKYMHTCHVVLQLHYNSLAPKACDGSSMDSVSEGSSSEDDSTPGKHKVLGSARLGRLFGS